MLSFKDFLSEARMAPLYHATNTIAAANILKDNVLKTSFSDYKAPASTSFTRSFDFSKYWTNTYTDEKSADTIVFEIDQQKLAQNYKIKPFNFYNHKTRETSTLNKRNEHRNEYEERVTKNITNFDKYITKIIVLDKPGKRIGGNLILNHPKLYYDGKFVNK